MKYKRLKKTIFIFAAGIVLSGFSYTFYAAGNANYEWKNFTGFKHQTSKFNPPFLLTPPDKPYNIDSIIFPGYIKRMITYNKVYPFIRYNQNYLEWNDYASVSWFFDKIKQTPKRKLKVLHIGDSHVQSDIFTGYVRNEIQKMFGNGGRGFVFPYAAAHTHSAYDYRTSCKGKWDYSRNLQPYPAYDMGITGATIHTEDSSASFKFAFPQGALNRDYNVLKIYCKLCPESFNLKLKVSGVPAPLYIDCSSFHDKLYIEIKLPEASDTLEFFINKTDTVQNFFEFYGLLIETSDNKGILYNSAGINGAGLSSILKENLLLYQISGLKPDLVVIDLGLNDFYKVPFNSALIEKNLSSIIDIVQYGSPDASIILCDGQDVYYRYWNEGNCKKYAALMREIAFRKSCAFYDYYYVSGGQYSMLNWLKNRLARYDKVHLTAAGYYVRGELFLNAILNSYYISLTRPELKTFIAASEFPDTLKQTVQIVSKNIPEIKDTDVTASAIKEQTMVWKTQTLYYKIKTGDNLGAIAKKYGVTIKQLQTWNGIKGSSIIAGKTLIIYKQILAYDTGVPAANTTIVQTTQPKTTTQTQPKTVPKTTQQNTKTKPVTLKGTVKYVVKSGDNLWSIAKKYGTTTEKIMKLNNMTSDKLKPGTTLIINK